MNDPALDAAQRALGNRGPDEFTNEVGDAALRAAREALRPVRARMDELRKVYATRCDPSAAGVNHALDELAPLVGNP